ncbi:RES family NAD+ phosphorylase [Herbiconiux sp. CPCC 203407]|uniref:RES family NAD+ phosphorylase n=1 Tax=Herbiconiux oxytropis TaxID=2970915 RepID=A0AA42BV85_9MICO|nr:RES family NAD+ phosphorylase [Herbiconiux oxytropis]MCS5723649.1 RES family NAD+ phosphorylase [Herbiconiux oxytropis]MCS5726966.1 RES family NAD+ phosphorylase [Herbiconiux oxytropis]
MPGQDLSGFPTEVLHEGRNVHRSHHPDFDPCFFNGTPDSRFNLTDGRGTCYVADDIVTAVREKLREHVLGQGIVPAGFANSFVVSTIRIDRSFTCADVGSPDSLPHKVTRMLATMDDYEVPQRWAATFDAAGFEGIRYGSSYTNGPDTAWALFGDEGERRFGEEIESLPGAAACSGAGIEVYGLPHSDELETI